MEMDWEAVVLDWVNCLRLTDGRVNCIEELSDGKFLCEILQLLFHKTVDFKNKGEVFQVLEETLQDLFTPPDWITFSEAFDGNREELTKILSILMGVFENAFEEDVEKAIVLCQTDFEGAVVVRKTGDTVPVSISTKADPSVLLPAYDGFPGTDVSDPSQTDCNQNYLTCAPVVGTAEESHMKPTSPYPSLNMQRLLYFEIGLLMLVLFMGIVAVLSIMVPFWWNNELYLGFVDFSQAADKYGHLQHLDRPII